MSDVRHELLYSVTHVFRWPPTVCTHQLEQLKPRLLLHVRYIRDVLDEAIGPCLGSMTDAATGTLEQYFTTAECCIRLN